VAIAREGKRVVRLGGESNNSKIREECKSYLVDGENACELEQAEVICATCSGSGSGKLQQKGIYCHTVLLDEGSQATESSCLVPLCRGAQHLIIVGDQCQLEPMVKSDFAKANQLGRSLFNRLYKQRHSATMLNIQHRMHPFICEFPSAAFYGARLLTGVNASDRAPSQFWEWPSSGKPVCFVDVHDGVEDSSGDQIVNEREAFLVEKAVFKLLKDPRLKKLIDGTYPLAVVTGYAAQKALIQKRLVDSGLVDKEHKCLIEVNTVDAFQGREKHVIIFSAVRANGETVGFLRDWRRLNVMLTRARNGLIVFGHRETLQWDYFWGNWLRWASSNGCIMGEDAKGKWASRCLLPEEWTMKIGEVEDIEKDLRGHEDLAHELPSASRMLGEKTNTCLSNVTCDSWDDDFTVCCLSEKAETYNSTLTYRSWEDDDTSSELAKEDYSIGASESSFSSQSESDVAESWESLHADDLDDDTCRGPLEKMMQDC
jgi:hypothetical protein